MTGAQASGRQAAGGGASDNTRGAVLMMGAMAAFTVSDTFTKSLSGDVPLFQLLFLRGVIASGLIAILAWQQGALNLRVPARDQWLIALRMVAEIGAAYFFVSALFVLPLANLTAILQALPLTVTLSAALLFREPLGWRRLTAILVGFGGVLLIVRPGADGFTVQAGFALASVVCVTVRDLATRRLSGATPSLMVTLATSTGVMAFFGLGSIGTDWVAIDAWAAWRILGAATAVLVGYVLSVRVMRVGDIGFVAPFRYTSLIWALALGWLVFGHWPAPLTLVGAAIVVASGLFTFWRERQLALRRPPV